MERLAEVSLTMRLIAGNDILLPRRLCTTLFVAAGDRDPTPSCLQK